MFVLVTNQLYIDIISCLIYFIYTDGVALSIQSDKKTCKAFFGNGGGL